jgi:hypothetical protein
VWWKIYPISFFSAETELCKIDPWKASTDDDDDANSTSDNATNLKTLVKAISVVT